MRLWNLFAVLALVLAPAAVEADVVAVCGPSAGFSHAALATALVQSEAKVAMPLALWRDDKGFDLLLNWGERNQESLRAEGADILGNEFGSQLIHLVVVRAGSKNLEHFLFSFENDSPGELIWNGPSSSPAADEPLSYETTCIKAN